MLTAREKNARGGGWAVIGGCLATAIGTLLSKNLLNSVPPLSLMAAELVFSAAAAWGAAFAFSRLPARRDFLRISAPGILQPALVWVLVFAGLKTTPASVEALLFASETIVVVLFAWLLIGEKPTGIKLILCAVSTAGVLLVTQSAAVGAAPPLTGCILIFGGVVAAALDTVVCRALLDRADPLAMTAAIHVPSLLIVAGACLVWPEPGWRALLAPGLLAQTAFAGILLHAGAALLFNKGLVTVDAGTAALLLPTLSVMTVAGGLLFFGEHLSPGQWLGAALVIAAAIAIGSFEARRRKTI